MIFTNFTYVPQTLTVQEESVMRMYGGVITSTSNLGRTVMGVDKSTSLESVLDNCLLFVILL